MIVYIVYIVILVMGSDTKVELFTCVRLSQLSFDRCCYFEYSLCTLYSVNYFSVINLFKLVFVGEVFLVGGMHMNLKLLSVKQLFLQF